MNNLLEEDEGYSCSQEEECHVEMARLKAKVRMNFYKAVEDLQRKRDEDRSSPAELKAAREAEWEELISRTEKAWSEVAHMGRGPLSHSQ